jgi:hypothetical protein
VADGKKETKLTRTVYVTYGEVVPSYPGSLNQDEWNLVKNGVH